jgi:SSS family solute:Na+ symporter
VSPGLSNLDRLVLLAYVAVLVALGLRRSLRRGRDDVAAYLVAGRAVALPGFVANLVASWYGGILGVGEYSYRYGVSNWLVFGVPYYVAALLFALVVAPRARRSQSCTIPEQLHAAYGPTAGALGAVIVFCVTLPGAYLLMAGTIVREALGVPLAAAVVGVAVLSGFYLLFGGMRAIVAADRYYFVLMFASFGLLVAFLVAQHGGLEFLRRSLPPEQFTWNGGRPVQAVLVWYVIALATLVEPAFYEACFSARDPGTARRGILISICFWALFDLLTTTSGLYARALLPDLDDPVRAYPALGARVLPELARGLFFAGMLATVMSTVDSYLFISAQTLGHDLAGAWRARVPDAVSNHRTRLALVACIAAGSVMALAGFSVVELWHHLGSIGTPALLVPMLASFHPRLRPAPRVAVAAMLASAAVALAWLIASRGGERGYWLGLEPIFPALAVSLGTVAASRPWTRRT